MFTQLKQSTELLKNYELGNVEEYENKKGLVLLKVFDRSFLDTSTYKLNEHVDDDQPWQHSIFSPAEYAMCKRLKK